MRPDLIHESNGHATNGRHSDGSDNESRGGAVVIFGGAGFIGCNWAHWLLANTACDVRIFDNFSREGVRENLNALLEAGGARVRFIQADIRDRRAVEDAIAGAHEVYHFAAQVAVTTSVDDPRADFEVNAAGTLNILEAVRHSRLRPFLLFTSTNKVYGALGSPQIVREGSRYRFAAGGDDHARGISESQPLDFRTPYGCSKGTADQYVLDYARMYGVRSVVLRMSCIAGERQRGTEDQGWVAHFLYRAMAGEPITIFGDGRQVRDVLNVRDLVAAFAALRRTPFAEGKVFNVGGGEANSVSLLELLDDIKTMLGQSPQVEFREPRPGDQLVYITDHSLITATTGWRPRSSVRATLQHIAAWRKAETAAATDAGSGPSLHIRSEEAVA